MIDICKHFNWNYQLIESSKPFISRGSIEKIINNSEYLNSRFFKYQGQITYGMGTVFVEAEKCELWENHGKIAVMFWNKKKMGFINVLDEIPFKFNLSFSEKEKKKKKRHRRNERIEHIKKEYELQSKYALIKNEYIEPLSYVFGNNKRVNKKITSMINGEDNFSKDFALVQTFWYRGMSQIISKYFSGLYRIKSEREKDKKLMLEWRDFIKAHKEDIEDHANGEEYYLVESACANMENLIHYLCFVKFNEYLPEHMKWPKR